MKCNHIIGKETYGSGLILLSKISSMSNKDLGSNYHSFNFCPRCGMKLKDLVKEEVSNRIKFLKHLESTHMSK